MLNLAICSNHSQKYRKMVFKTNYCLNQVKNIAECSKGRFLQYFWPTLSYQLSLRPLFCLSLSGRFTQVLLYVPKSHKLALFDFLLFSEIIIGCYGIKYFTRICRWRDIKSSMYNFFVTANAYSRNSLSKWIPQSCRIKTLNWFGTCKTDLIIYKYNIQNMEIETGVFWYGSVHYIVLMTRCRRWRVYENGGLVAINIFQDRLVLSKKEGKDQESIQSSTTPDPIYQWEINKLTIRHHKREPRGQPFPSRWPQGNNKQTRTKA